MTNGLSHFYHLDESSLFLGASGVFLFYFISFFGENPVSKQNIPRCGVTSGAILFDYVP